MKNGELSETPHPEKPAASWHGLREYDAWGGPKSKGSFAVFAKRKRETTMSVPTFAELQALHEAHTEWDTNGKKRHFQMIWLKTLDAIVTALELPEDHWAPFPGRDPNPKLIWDFVDYALWFTEGTIELRLDEEEERRPYTFRVALVRDVRDIYNDAKAYWSVSLAPGANAEKDFEVIGKASPESNETIDEKFLASLRKFLLE